MRTLITVFAFMALSPAYGDRILYEPFETIEITHNEGDSVWIFQEVDSGLVVLSNDHFRRYPSINKVVVSPPPGNYVINYGDGKTRSFRVLPYAPEPVEDPTIETKEPPIPPPEEPPKQEPPPENSGTAPNPAPPELKIPHTVPQVLGLRRYDPRRVVITVVTARPGVNCPPCEVFKARDLPILRATGARVNVEYNEGIYARRPTPSVGVGVKIDANRIRAQWINPTPGEKMIDAKAVLDTVEILSRTP